MCLCHYHLYRKKETKTMKMSEALGWSLLCMVFSAILFAAVESLIFSQYTVIQVMCPQRILTFYTKITDERFTKSSKLMF